MNATTHRWLQALARAYRPAARRGMLIEGAWPWPVPSRPTIGGARVAAPASSARAARTHAAGLHRAKRPAA